MPSAFLDWSFPSDSWRSIDEHATRGRCPLRIGPTGVRAASKVGSWGGAPFAGLGWFSALSDAGGSREFRGTHDSHSLDRRTPAVWLCRSGPRLILPMPVTNCHCASPHLCPFHPKNVNGDSREDAKAQRRRIWMTCAAHPEGERGCFSPALRLRAFARESLCPSPFLGSCKCGVRPLSLQIFPPDFSLPTANVLP
jgi:hypothetical protein